MLKSILSRKTIRIACLGAPNDYRTSLVPLIVQHLGFKIDWTNPGRADLLIYGSFYDVNAPRLRWLPRSWRLKAGACIDAVDKQLAKRRIPPLTLFHTAENLRHDHVHCDYAISHDLNIELDSHFRLPYWMEMIDWSHEGVVGNSNPRYGKLLKLEKLLAPLGDQYLKRDQKAILITSHLREPKASCYAALEKLMPVDGMGPFFDCTIRDHNHSNFLKRDILEAYAYNLCPENGIYPGYITEKIPEAFSAGCLPISFIDESVKIDFNPKSFINLASVAKNNFSDLKNIFQSQLKMASFADEPLIVEQPSISSLQSFIHKLLINT